MVETFLPEHAAAPAPYGAPVGLFQLSPNVESVLQAEIAAEFHDRQFASFASFSLPRNFAPASLAPAGMTVVREISNAVRRVLHLEEPGHAAVVVIATCGSNTWVEIYGRSHAIVAELWREIRCRASTELDPERFIPCQLWSNTGAGSNSQHHEVPGVPWSQARRNYSASTAASLDSLMTLTTPSDERGRLLLWHGPAGTGKTTAATSLMTAWLPWCETHIITDPEQFFLAPTYLMEVTQRNSGTGLNDPLPRMDEPWPRQWKLIICEDADEYLRSDARQRSGPALGRLLNLTDGLMGRGSDTIVLLTTNDDLGRLHPAVTRPGRCIATVKFPALSPAEAAAWCPTGIAPPTSETTLAELFALAAGGRPPEGGHPVGLYL